MINHHHRDRSITTYVSSKQNLHPQPREKTNQIVRDPRKPNNHRQTSSDTPQTPPTSQPEEKKTQNTSQPFI